MGHVIKLYFLTLAVFLIVDLAWLGFVARDFYREQLGNLMRANVNWTAAIIFYLIFIGGILFFVVYPALERDSMVYALLVGGLFGFITYATYDLTNLATLQGWPLTMTLVDLAWGTFLGASVSFLSFVMDKFLL